MQLAREEIAKIIHNVMAYEFDEDGKLYFRRFTESQYDAIRYGHFTPSQYDAVRPESRHWLLQAKASASVTFDFISDSDYLTMLFEAYPRTAQEWVSFDLYVDGIFYEHWHRDHLNVKLAEFHLPAGEHRITLYFPWSVEIAVKEVHVSDGASVVKVEKCTRAIVFGDSITQGAITRFSSLTYVNQVARNLNLELVNQGIGGCRFVENFLDDSIVPYAPDLILIAYGTNDYKCFDSEEEFQRNASAYIQKLVALFPQTRILAILPLYRNDEAHRLREKNRSYTFDDAKRILHGEYGRYKNIWVLRETGIPRIPEAFAGDYLHPNEMGFTFVAKSVETRLEKMMNNVGQC